MGEGLLGGEQPQPHHLGGAGVVGGALLDGATAHQVGAAVADMADQRLIPAQDEHGDRRHRRDLPAAAVIPDGTAGGRERVAQPQPRALDVQPCGRAREGVDGHPSRRPAGPVATQVGGDGEDMGAGTARPGLESEAPGLGGALRPGVGAEAPGDLRRRGARGRGGAEMAPVDPHRPTAEMRNAWTRASSRHRS